MSRPQTPASVAEAKAREAEMARLALLADDIYDTSMEGFALEPSVGKAAAELDAHWQGMMSVLAMEQQAYQNSPAGQQKGVKVRMPKSPRPGRSPRAGGKDSEAAPGLPPAPSTPRGSTAGASAAPTKRPVTSEGVTMMHTFNSHTELRTLTKRRAGEKPEDFEKRLIDNATAPSF